MHPPLRDLSESSRYNIPPRAEEESGAQGNTRLGLNKIDQSEKSKVEEEPMKNHLEDAGKRVLLA